MVMRFDCLCCRFWIVSDWSIFSSRDPHIMSEGAVKEERAGWLQKWTNYIKGYRQRWFVLDSNGNLSYYRNQHDVGESCRGSINLQEARILSDKVTNNIVISASSQTFHLKAGNDVDRQKWLSALEYARHKAIKQAESDEDDDAQAEALRGREAVATANRALQTRLDSLRTCAQLLNKHGEELIRCAGETDLNKKTLAERAGLFKITTCAVLKAAEEFCALSEKEVKKLGRVVHNEQQQKLRLQEQLETLALQHSNLERAAARSNSNALPYSSDVEEEFHDAEEDLCFAERKSGSSRQGSMCGESTKEDEAYFRAEIVSSTSNNQQLAVQPTNGRQVCESSGRVRRLSIPDRPDLPLNLWSIMKNCIGKELSKIPMPVNFSEPLSVLQRITEDLEYGNILENSVNKDPLQQMCYVAAYAVSCYSTTGNRTTKPFNPLLGETYECDRMDDLGWRSFTEQVSHHPPAAAHHAEGRGWVMFQDFTMTSRFRGKYLSVIPVGSTHVHFPGTTNHYSYKKVTTTVHNIIVGKLWIDNHGEMEIINHGTGDRCSIKFHPYSYFSRDTARKVTGLVKDKTGKIHYVVQGTWDKSIDMMKVTKCSGNGDKAKLETEAPQRLWTVNESFKGHERMYHFTKLAIQLNEPEENVAPTDSRLRPDQRLMEEGKWDEANKKKLEVEEEQRLVRRKREADMEKAMQQGLPYEEYQPLWFTKQQDELTGTLMHFFNGDYWQAKEKGDWSMCPQLF